MTVRSGFGEYTTRETAAYLARTEFLKALARLCPDVLLDLGVKVLPVYEAAVARSDTARAKLPNLDTSDEAVSVGRMRRVTRMHEYARAQVTRPGTAIRRSGGGRMETKDPELRAAVEGWATSHGLNKVAEEENQAAEWVIEAALVLVHHWYRVEAACPFECSAWPRNRWTRFPTRVVHVATFRPPIFDIPEWAPSMETKDHHRERAIALLGGLLDGFYKTTERDFRTWEIPVNRRSLQLHMGWLVRYQVIGWQYAAIAREERKARGQGRTSTDGATADAVRKAVKRGADLLGIELREGTPGRPAFSCTVNTRDHSDTRSRPHKKRR